MTSERTFYLESAKISSRESHRTSFFFACFFYNIQSSLHIGDLATDATKKYTVSLGDSLQEAVGPGICGLNPMVVH